MRGKTPNDLIRIAAAGGGFVIDATGLQVNDLVRIAAAGSHQGARLGFAGIQALSTNDLVRIAAAGSGCVQFLP